MLNRRYAVVDLETTGNDINGENRIIQIGCTFIENGRIIDEYSSDVNPERSVPDMITRLTGITQERVNSAPKFSDIAGKVFAMLQGTNFVAHNVNFDFPFLNDEFMRSGYPSLDIPAIDTVTLSQVIFAKAPGYRLRDLTHYLGIEHLNPHSANSDSRATAYVLIHLLKKIQGLPLVTLEELTKLGKALPRDTFEVVKEALNTNKEQKKDLPSNLTVVNGIALRRPDSYRTAPVDSIAEFPMTKKEKQHLFGDYLSIRKTQSSLMNYVFRNLRKENIQNLVIEAPTGMGKTLGYLLPLAYLSVIENRQMVVSVPTTVLQEQVLQEGNRMLNRILPTPINLEIVKSNHNYLNLDLLEKQLKNGQLSKESKLLAMKVMVWLLETNTGDLDEINQHVGFSNFIEEVRYHGVAIQEKTNPFFEFDFYRRNLARRQTANILITNHNFLIKNIDEFTKKNNYNSPFLVVDEAQHFVSDLKQSNEIIIDLAALQNKVTKINENIKDWLFKTQRSGQTTRLSQTDLLNVQNILLRLTNNVEGFQAILFDKFVKKIAHTQLTGQPFELAIDTSFLLRKNAEWKRIYDDLANGVVAIQKLVQQSNVDHLLSEDRNLLLNIQKDTEILEIAYESMKNVIQKKSKGEVFSVLVGPNHDQRSIRVAREIAEATVFYNSKVEKIFAKTLLIGGTLFAGHNRKYFLQNFDFNSDSTKIRTFNSEIDYQNRLKFEVLDSDFSISQEKSYQNYEQFLAESIYKLTKGIDKQTLVLFNSLETLAHVYGMLRMTDLNEDRKVLAQGINGSRAKIIREFNDEENAIVLGAASFWEGVDFPGDQLEYLIITRLPFRSPEDKLSQLAKVTSKNVFQSFLLPDALLTFKQGIGRVIRKSDDRGAVVVLDRRIIDRKYGKQFISQLPNGVANEINDVTKIRNDLKKFYRFK